MTSFPPSPTNRYPTATSALASLCAALLGCFAGITKPIQIAALFVLAAGLALFVAGTLCRRRGGRFSGRVLTGCGLAVLLAGCISPVLLSPPTVESVPIAACGLGLVLLAFALFPVYARWLRGIATAGLLSAVCGVVANAALVEPPLWRSVCAVALLLVSWDTAERSLLLGTQVDPDTETTALEVGGATTTALVGGVAVLVTLVVASIPVGNASPLGIGLLFLAVVSFGLVFARFQPNS
ncbi:DUF7519 family protein [Halopiger thermotolerans]